MPAMFSQESAPANLFGSRRGWPDQKCQTLVPFWSGHGDPMWIRGGL